MTIPLSERQKFESCLYGQSERFGLSPEEYLRKVWYHEEAAKIGEYMAMTFLEQLLPLIPIKADEQTEELASA